MGPFSILTWSRQRRWARVYQGVDPASFNSYDIDCFIQYDRVELLSKACAPDAVTYDTVTTCLSQDASLCLEYVLKHLKVGACGPCPLTRFQVDPSDAGMYEARCCLPGTSLACMQIVARVCPQMFPLVATECDEWCVVLLMCL